MEEEECLYLMISKPIILVIFLFMATAFGQDSIIFPHNSHIEDEELECTVCHADVEKSSSLDESLLPLMEVCSDCHDVDEDCEMCHESPDDADTYPVSGSTSGLDFSHLFHLDSFSDCSRCHSQSIEDDGTAIRMEWQSWKCSACHQENKPQDHDISWSEFHGMSLQEHDDPRCATCHTEKFCESCHSQSQFEPKTHNPNYMYTHGLEARVEILECSTCHHIENDCRKCHQQNMVLPSDHTVQWTGFDSAGQHGSEALDQPERCQVCHSTYSCERCHGGDE